MFSSNHQGGLARTRFTDIDCPQHIALKISIRPFKSMRKQQSTTAKQLTAFDTKPTDVHRRYSPDIMTWSLSCDFSTTPSIETRATGGQPQMVHYRKAKKCMKRCGSEVDCASFKMCRPKYANDASPINCRCAMARYLDGA